MLDRRSPTLEEATASGGRGLTARTESAACGARKGFLIARNRGCLVALYASRLGQSVQLFRRIYTGTPITLDQVGGNALYRREFSMKEFLARRLPTHSLSPRPERGRGVVVSLRTTPPFAGRLEESNMNTLKRFSVFPLLATMLLGLCMLGQRHR